MLSVVMLNIIMPSVIVLFVKRDGMLNVVMLCAVMLNVVAPKKSLELFGLSLLLRRKTAPIDI
jgi:hypothetical protein